MNNEVLIKAENVSKKFYRNFFSTSLRAEGKELGAGAKQSDSWVLGTNNNNERET